MNRVVATEQARAEIAERKERCRQSYDRCGGLDMGHVFMTVHDFHRECRELREAEERLRLLELRASLEPANDTAPPSVFERHHRRARTTGELAAALGLALSPIDRQRLRVESVYQWDPGSDVFLAVAHWARVELAHALGGQSPAIAGLTVPARFAMPVALEGALCLKIEPAKKTRKRVAP